MSKITLDKDVFDVLASDTRIMLMKSLDDQRMTLSELSRAMELKKTTVSEHLQKLQAVELVKRREREGSKWVYYDLTWKGKKLLHPENTVIAIMLSTAIAALGGAFWSLGHYLSKQKDDVMLMGAPPQQEGTDASREVANDMLSNTELAFWISIALFAAVALLVGISFYIRYRARRGAKERLPAART